MPPSRLQYSKSCQWCPTTSFRYASSSDKRSFRSNEYVSLPPFRLHLRIPTLPRFFPAICSPTKFPFLSAPRETTTLSITFPTPTTPTPILPRSSNTTSVHSGTEFPFISCRDPPFCNSSLDVPAPSKSTVSSLLVFFHSARAQETAVAVYD